MRQSPGKEIPSKTTIVSAKSKDQQGAVMAMNIGPVKSMLD
jgi:hypothetical protein